MSIGQNISVAKRLCARITATSRSFKRQIIPANTQVGNPYAKRGLEIRHNNYRKLTKHKLSCIVCALPREKAGASLEKKSSGRYDPSHWLPLTAESKKLAPTTAPSRNNHHNVVHLGGNLPRVLPHASSAHNCGVLPFN